MRGIDLTFYDSNLAHSQRQIHRTLWPYSEGFDRIRAQNLITGCVGLSRYVKTSRLPLNREGI